MITRWYGQWECDKAIAGYFWPGYIGSCIEVGAVDGCYLSNTYAFELEGWTSLEIEPNPEYWIALQRNRKHVMNCAVGCGGGNANLMVFEFDGFNHAGCTAIRPDMQLVNQYRARHIRTVPVPLKTLDECIQESGIFKQIDFVSVDTEGTELDVLKSFDIERWKPKLFIVENNYDRPDVADHLSQFGYFRHRRFEINDFFVHEH